MPRGVYVKKLGVHGKYERTSEIRARLSKSITPIAKANAQDPEWRQRVSDGTKKRMHDSAVRERHLLGLAKARRESPTGSSWRGGQGCEPNDLEKSYDWLLALGYVSNFPIQVQHNLRYRIDYALLEQKVCIEIDGPTHKHKTVSDAAKAYALEILGWKVVRIRHW